MANNPANTSKTPAVSKQVANGGSIAAAQAKKPQKDSKSKKEPENLKQWVVAYQSQFARALPEIITPERFVRMAITAINQTPELAGCEPNSFLGAMMVAAQLGLEPNTTLGQAYILPFYNKKNNVLEASFVLGYPGMIDLAYRSGNVKDLNAHVVYAADDFRYKYGVNAMLDHVPSPSADRGPITYIYAIYKSVQGGVDFEVMSAEQMLAHAQRYSKAFNYGPWQTNFDSMGKKTVIKQLLKYKPLSSDFARGMASDGTTQTLILPTNPADEIEMRTTYIMAEDPDKQEAQ